MRTKRSVLVTFHDLEMSQFGIMCVSYKLQKLSFRPGVRFEIRFRDRGKVRGKDKGQG